MNLPESDYSVKFSEHFERLSRTIREQNERAFNEFTEKELARLIGQALVAGDFQNLVTRDNQHALIYIPFREVTELRAEVERLKEELREVKATGQELESESPNLF